MSSDAVEALTQRGIPQDHSLVVYAAEIAERMRATGESA
jgi:hypothetical protein